MVGKVTIPYTFATMATGNVPASDLDACFTALNNGLAPPFMNYLAAFTLSNDSTNPNTVLDVAPGLAADSANAVWIQTSATFYGSTGGSWAAGAGTSGSPVNKMGTGLSVAASTWYHVFAIINGGASDIYFDTSVSAANQPSGTTAIRRLGSFKTDSNSHILAFSQVGDTFIWGVSPLDVNAQTPGSSSRTLYTLSVPPGISVRAEFRADMPNSSAAIIFTSPLETDQAPGGGNAGTDMQTSSTGNQGGRFLVVTNTLAQIGARQNGSPSLYLSTFGWTEINRRF